MRALTVFAASLVVISCGSTPPVAAGCDTPQTLCSSKCVTLATDDANCGACGAACDPDGACVASMCYPKDCSGTDCSPSQVCPSGMCVDRACIGVTCTAAQVCFQGSCVATTCANTTCAAGFACINDACVDGACLGVICASGRTCSLGVCVDTAKCVNGTHDVDEAGVDCGGVCPARCGDGAPCVGGNDCASGICTNSICAPPVPGSCTDGKKSGAESDIDCGGAACPKCGTGLSCTAPGDCASGNCLPGSMRCSDTCGNAVKDTNETDVDCGGACVTKCALSRACTQASDCASNRCVNMVCTAPSCTDLVTDGDETDVDCGGSCPNRCNVDGGCSAGADCVEQVCGASRCQPPSCTDGKKNGTESDLDCGRMCPTRCAAGQLCVVANDCAIGQCTAGRCPNLTPSCMDTFLNQDEVDTDCGGTICTKCGAGKTCRVNGDCLSGFCSRERVCVAGFSQVRMFGGATWGIASGDLNADGITDLVSIENNNTLNTYLGQVDAGFLAPTPITISVSGYSNAMVALADFVGDTRLDALAIATNTGTNETLLFRGSMTGFQAPTVVSGHPGGTNHHAMTVADLDNDGKLDVATAWGGAGVMPGGFTVMKGGALGLAVAATVTITGRSPAATTCYAIGAGKIDADTLPDLAIGCEPNQVWVALNQGNMVFQLASTVPTVNGVPYAIVAFDFTGDNKIDLGVGDNTGRLGILTGSGTGTFSAPTNLLLNGWVQQLEMIDMNGDGNLDVLAGNSGVSMLLGDGMQGFNVGPGYGLAFYTPAMAAGDFDGNGKRDVCVVGLTNQTGLPNGIICRYQQ